MTFASSIFFILAETVVVVVKAVVVGAGITGVVARHAHRRPTIKRLLDGVVVHVEVFHFSHAVEGVTAAVGKGGGDSMPVVFHGVPVDFNIA